MCFFPSGCAHLPRQFTADCSNGISFDGTSIFPVERFWHLGTLRTAQRRGQVRSIVDDRISRASKKFFSLAKSVWKERAHCFSSRRTFLREVLQCLEWSLHTVALDAVHFQDIESAERRFFQYVCRVSRARPWVRELHRPGGPRRISYDMLLQFWDFRPFRRRLQRARLGFLRRLLLSPASQAKAALLGTFDFESPDRELTDWEKLIRIDHAHYNRVFCDKPLSFEQWLALMSHFSDDEWRSICDVLEASPEPVDFVVWSPEQVSCQCPVCHEHFHSRQQMLWHRKRAHPDGQDAAVAFFHSHRDACPFCLCIYRTQGGPGHFTRSPRTRSPTLCAQAHKQWELNGADPAALPVGSVVADAFVNARAVWLGISDGESWAQIQQRVTRWIAARRVSSSRRAAIRHLPHNIFLRAGKNCYRYSFFFGEGRHRKKFFGPWVPTLAAATAARDQRFRQIVRTAWDARQRRRTGLGPAPGSWGR